VTELVNFKGLYNLFKQ